MKRCAHCNGKFGLVRRSVFYITGLFINRIEFCSEKCERAYDQARRAQRKLLQFQRWLHS